MTLEETLNGLKTKIESAYETHVANPSATDLPLYSRKKTPGIPVIYTKCTVCRVNIKTTGRWLCAACLEKETN